MLWRLFRPKEVRWTLSALEELASRHPVFLETGVEKVARQKTTATFTRVCFERGYSALQTACVLLSDATSEVMFHGKGNFAYRGLLTANGKKVHAAFMVANMLLEENGVFSSVEAQRAIEHFDNEIGATG